MALRLTRLSQLGRTTSAQPVTLTDSAGDTDASPAATHVSSLHAQEPVVEPPPDGGLTAWLQVAGAFFAVLNSWGYVSAWSTFQDYFAQELLKDTPTSTISLVGSAQGFFMMSAGLIGGRLVDMGYLKPLLYGGVFLMVFGAMMTSFSTKFYQIFLAQGICLAIGSASVFIASVTVVGQYFSTKRITALSLSGSASSIGGVIFPLMARSLISKVGFPWAMRTVAFLMLLMLSFTALVMKSRVPPRVKGNFIDWGSFRDFDFLMTALGTLLGGAGTFSYMFYVDTYADSTNISPELVPYMIAILNAGAIPGRILPGFVADRVGSYNVLIPCISACIILAFSWIAVKSLSGQIAFAVVYGFFSGSFLALIPPVWSALTPDINRLGARTGLGLFLYSFAFWLAGPVTGELISKGQNGFIRPQVMGGCLCFGSLFCLSIVRFHRQPKILKKI